ncbi:hypothetical protein ACVWXL_003416 [Bradyrhizobium sp. GM22.5]
MGHGSAAHRRRGAAPRPGHESPKSSGIAIHVIRAVSHSRGLCGPSFAAFFAPKMPRAQGRPGAGWHPRSTVRRLRYERLHSGIQVKPNTRPSLRSGFTAYVVISPGSDALLPPSPCGWLTLRPGRPARITARLGAQTPGARTTRFCRTQAAPVVCATLSLTVARPCEAFAPVWPTSTTSHPAFVTIAIRPSAGLGWLFI